MYATNIGWQQLPLRQIVADAVGLPVVLDHDVRAAGLAELTLGAGRGFQEVLFVALGHRDRSGCDHQRSGVARRHWQGWRVGPSPGISGRRMVRLRATRMH